MKFSSDVAAAVSSSATRFGVDPNLLAAIIAQESGGNTFATRYEPAYGYLWDVEQNKPFAGAQNPATFPAPDFVSGPTEWITQKTSWGCGQVMGALARELGFVGKFLAELTDPVVGVEYCARQLARLAKKYTTVEDIASSYNAGRPSSMNQDTYVKPVLAFYASFKQGGF